MSKTNITIDTIAEAVATIEATGKKATIAAIQAIVGGSMTTVTKLVRELRGETESPKAVEVTEEGAELPPNITRALATVPTAILSALADVRAEERRSARAEIDAIRAEAESQVKAMADKLEAAQCEFEALAEQADKLESDLSAADEARKAAEIKASEAEKRGADKDKRIDDLVRQISELAAKIGKAEPKAKTAKTPAPKRTAPKQKAPQEGELIPLRADYEEPWVAVARAVAAGQMTAEEAVKHGSTSETCAIALVAGRPDLGQSYKTPGDIWHRLSKGQRKIVADLNPAAAKAAEEAAKTSEIADHA